MTNEEAINAIKSNYPPENYTILREGLDMAIEALEKQVPKKPVNYDSVPHSRCPVCNNAVKVFEDSHECHYCPYCGQRIN